MSFNDDNKSLKLKYTWTGLVNRQQSFKFKYSLLDVTRGVLLFQIVGTTLTLNDVMLNVQMDTRPPGQGDVKMSRGLVAWVAARYEASALPGEMRLGDGSWPGTGEYFNRPLGATLVYRVFLRASTANNVSRPRHSDLVRYLLTYQQQGAVDASSRSTFWYYIFGIMERKVKWIIAELINSFFLSNIADCFF